MIYCLNPACPHPENPDSNQLCHGCGLELSSPTVFRDRYRVVKLLGQSSLSRTYQAVDLNWMNRLCVIKRYTPKAQGAMLKQSKKFFDREAQKFCELEHPQIPTLYTYFDEDKSCYVVEEFVQGQNLLAILNKQGLFREKLIFTILLDLLPVLGYIHKQGFLHMDIKPENIILSPVTEQTGKKNVLKLIDFGWAKQTFANAQTGTGAAIYTPGYAAMEHVMGKACEASDLYCLGATCARLLTGCLPVPNQSRNSQNDIYDFNNARWLWRERLQEMETPISPGLAKVLDKLLQPFAQNRFQSAGEILNLLNNRQSPSKQTSSVKTVVMAEAPVGLPKKERTFDTFQFEVIAVNDRGEGVSFEFGEAKYFSQDLGERVKLEMVSIPAGEFLFGSPATELERPLSDIPQQSLKVPTFFMSKYPITQAQWQAVMKANPSRFQGSDRPVEQISWYEAIEFCQQLSAKTGRDFRLPTEVEWEYAARAGTDTPFHFGETITTELANYDGNCSYGKAPKGSYRQRTINVGSFPPNAFGLYDMHGNVREWCADVWQERYKGSDTTYKGKNDNRFRTLRGGSWVDHPLYCRSASRYGISPDLKSFIIGFRVVCY
jgi:formylglycine-generating enzyme required for sulfatase activity/tRNA A-37 threonylcarbamoyl transferase component Bud32